MASLQLSHQTRQRIKRFSRTVGFDEPLRKAYVAVDRERRRNAKDDEHLRVALAVALEADSNCIDVGAHAGDVLRDMVRLSPRGRHLAFEPLPDFQAELRRRFPQVEVHGLALSDRAESTTFAHVVSDPGYSGLRRRPYPGEPEVEEIPVQTARLDDVLPGGYVPRFIKIDVEGAELQVMRGALDTLRRHRPTVYFEHSSAACAAYDATSREVYDLLTGEGGLRVFDVDGNGPLSAAEFTGPQRVWNFIARR